jgi:hypothetical protein
VRTVGVGSEWLPAARSASFSADERDARRAALSHVDVDVAGWRIEYLLCQGTTTQCIESIDRRSSIRECGDGRALRRSWAYNNNNNNNNSQTTPNEIQTSKNRATKYLTKPNNNIKIINNNKKKKIKQTNKKHKKLKSDKCAKNERISTTTIDHEATRHTGDWCVVKHQR